MPPYKFEKIATPAEPTGRLDRVENCLGLRDWPPRMEIGEEMKRKVQERWREDGFVWRGCRS